MNLTQLHYGQKSAAKDLHWSQTYTCLKQASASPSGSSITCVGLWQCRPFATFHDNEAATLLLSQAARFTCCACDLLKPQMSHLVAGSSKPAVSTSFRVWIPLTSSPTGLSSLLCLLLPCICQRCRSRLGVRYRRLFVCLPQAFKLCPARDMSL